MPDGTIVYPAHGAGSLCGVGISDRPESTIGYERHCNVFMATSSKERFIAKMLGSVPQFPDYYKRMKALDSEGATALKVLPGEKPLSATAFRTEVEKAGSVILDVRTPDAFGGAHIPGAFNIGAGPNLSLWAGWVLPYEGDIFLVGDNSSADLEYVRKSLVRVGHDRIAGHLQGGINSWIAAGFEQAHLRRSPFENYMRRSRMEALYSMSEALVNGRRGISNLLSTSHWAIYRSACASCRNRNDLTSYAAAVIAQA